MSEEYNEWTAQVRGLVARNGQPLPAEHVLSVMFDDGLDPEEVTDPVVLARYAQPPRRRADTSGNVSEVLKRLSNPDG